MRPSQRSRTLALACLAMLAAAHAGRAQQPSPAARSTATPAATDPARRVEEFLKAEEAGAAESRAPAAQQDQALPEAPVAGALDEAARQRYQNAMQAYYDYRVSGYSHRKSLFAWQFYSSIIIFFVVIFLVLSGIYFSWVQFRASMYAPAAPPRAAPTEVRQTSVGESVELGEGGGGKVVESVAESRVTKFKASMEGIEVSSPVLGVIILSISLIFFFLYLKMVYPINNVF